MEVDDRIVLTTWANGRGGASVRLARRAWWVLMDRGEPIGGRVGAWANAAEAQRWLRDYYAIGLIGLLDLPRPGRPRKHNTEVNRALEKLKESRSGRVKNTQRDIASEVLTPLSLSQRQALWRDLREIGENVYRKRNGLDLAVPVNHDLRNVACVLLTENVRILAFMAECDAVWSDLNGTWINVPHLPTKNKGWSKRGISLRDALNFEVSARSSNKKGGGGLRAKREELMTARAIDHIYQMASDNTAKLSVRVFFDIRNGASAIKVLKRLKERNLWVDRSGRNPGFLGDLRISPFVDSWALNVQTALAEELHESHANALDEFYDALTLRRVEPFCWLRAGDSESEAKYSELGLWETETEVD